LTTKARSHINGYGERIFTMPIGFIGLGNLGRAMAGRLVNQSVDLVVWNRTIETAYEFAEKVDLPKPTDSGSSEPGKVTVVQSAGEVAEQADIIILNLFDSPAVHQVLNGVDGLLAGNFSGKIIIDTTTNNFETVALFYKMVSSVKGIYLEAPVLGSVVPATQGNLTMLISGDGGGYEKAKPYLDILAKTIFFLEIPRLATRMKLVNNLVLGSFMATLAEALVHGELAGLSREKVLEILAAGAGNSAVLNAKRQKLIDGDFSPHFSIGAIHKDLVYLEDMVDQSGKALTMGAIAEELFRQAKTQGLEQEDLSSVYLVLKDL
jgi:3-hydroxyisobutyrate dehydrogenase